MLAIDNMAYRSKLSKVDPKAKLCFTFGPLITVLVFSNVWVSLCCLLAMAAMCLKFSKVGIKKYMKLMAIPLGFLFIGTLTIMINRHPLDRKLLLGFSFGEFGYGVSKESLFFGLRLILRTLACVSCGYFLSLNTPMNQLFEVLRAWKLPDLLVSLMELMYRYIFVVLEESNRIFVAQSSRGIGQNFSARLKAFGELVASLLQRSLGRCNRIVLALESRGYEGRFYFLNEVYTSGSKLYGACFGLMGILIFLGLWR